MRTLGNANLTEDQVRKIRKLHACGLGCSQIAEEYPVGRRTISAIVNRRTWKWVK